MTFNNRATDGQSDAHASILRCIERLKQSVRIFPVESDPRISDAQRSRFPHCADSEIQAAIGVDFLNSAS